VQKWPIIGTAGVRFNQTEIGAVGRDDNIVTTYRTARL
jgi:hypothetical protein